MLAAMSVGETTLGMALRSDDTDGLSRALEALGARIEAQDGRPAGPGDGGAHPGFRVQGVGGAFPAGEDAALHLGDGGTPTRFMMAVAAFARRRVTIDGTDITHMPPHLRTAAERHAGCVPRGQVRRGRAPR